MPFMSVDKDVLVVSPGIDNNHQLVKYFLENSKPIISEIEFASYYCNAKKICITGTNGKTTTTLMVTYLLENAGYNVKAVGANATEQLITEPIIMMENEVLQVTAATANRLHVTLSVLEINRN